MQRQPLCVVPCKAFRETGNPRAACTGWTGHSQASRQVGGYNPGEPRPQPVLRGRSPCMAGTGYTRAQSVESSSAEAFVTPRLFDRIVQSPSNLVAIETADAAEVLDRMRNLAMRTGQSVYCWQEDAGITSLREREVRVPGSKRVSDALRYILQSMQFGVYLFTDFDDHLRAPNIGLLRQIARSTSGKGRKVVLVGAPMKMPDGLDLLLERIAYEPGVKSRPQLRDGRWIT